MPNKEQMMICPEAETCKHACPYRLQHIKDEECEVSNPVCPACIPVEKKKKEKTNA